MTLRAMPPFVLCAMTLAACGGHRGGGVDTAQAVDFIKNDEVRWNADWRSGDAARIAAHYAPNAVVMSPGAPPAVGTAAIQAAIVQAVAGPGFSLTFASDQVDVAASGDLATSHGAYRQTINDPKTGALVTQTGSYVTVYRPAPGGRWTATLDINTPDAPQATSGPEAPSGAEP